MYLYTFLRAHISKKGQTVQVAEGCSESVLRERKNCGKSGALNYLWYTTGSVTENTFLSPCRSTVILPEWFVTIECAMDRPSPK